MRKQKLIDAIRETIIDLETGRKVYSFIDTNNCNCGLLANNLGVKAEGHFSYAMQASRCAKTGAPLPLVFKAIMDVGLTLTDIAELEQLGNAKILKEADLGSPIITGTGYMGIRGSGKSEKENALAYFQAWLRILEREPSEPKEEPAYRFVEKHKSIKPLLEKEIIYS